MILWNYRIFAGHLLEIFIEHKNMAKIFINTLLTLNVRGQSSFYSTEQHW